MSAPSTASTSAASPSPGSTSPGSADVIRVAIVEDQEDVLRGLAYLVDGSPGFRCTDLFTRAEDLLAAPELSQFDVVLMDIDLPGISGIEATRALRCDPAAPLVVMLTVYADEEQIFASLRAGAYGYLLKTTPPAQLLESLVSVYRGGSPMSESIARRVVSSFRGPSPRQPAHSDLTEREEEVLGLLARGYRYREIADRLTIGFETVRTHIRHIYDKLQVRSRTEATAKYLGADLDRPSDSWGS